MVDTARDIRGNHFCMRCGKMIDPADLHPSLQRKPKWESKPKWEKK